MSEQDSERRKLQGLLSIPIIKTMVNRHQTNITEERKEEEVKERSDPPLTSNNAQHTRVQKPFPEDTSNYFERISPNSNPLNLPRSRQPNINNASPGLVRGATNVGEATSNRMASDVNSSEYIDERRRPRQRTFIRRSERRRDSDDNDDISISRSYANPNLGDDIRFTRRFELIRPNSFFVVENIIVSTTVQGPTTTSEEPTIDDIFRNLDSEFAPLNFQMSELLPWNRRIRSRFQSLFHSLESFTRISGARRNFLRGRSSAQIPTAAEIESLSVVSTAAKEKEDCPICYEVMQTDEPHFDIPCKHRFHTQCMRRSLENSGKCPLCRSLVIQS